MNRPTTDSMTLIASSRGISGLLPVIHFKDAATTLRNAEIAIEAGCDGVFLIHMDGLDHQLDLVLPALRQQFPSLKIGINRLASKALDALRRNADMGVDITWSDLGGVSSAGLDQEGEKARDWLGANTRHLFFASCAFKYQRAEPLPGRAARNALEAGFVPTTSGPATGAPPTVDKISDMAAALGSNKELAVASGITPENVGPFLPFVRYFLVATGISRSFYEFDRERVAALAKMIKG